MNFSYGSRVSECESRTLNFFEKLELSEISARY